MPKPQNTAAPAAVLAAVNYLRAERGLEPLNALPKGKRHLAHCCPVANALGGNVAVWPNGSGDYGPEWYISGEAAPRPLPDVLAEFADDFDEGGYPELVA